MRVRPLQNTCERVIGRLVEVRHDAGYQEPADVDAFVAQMMAHAARLAPNERVIVVADWRHCSRLVLGTDLANRVLEMFCQANPYLLRSAAIVRSDMPTAMMQMMRLVSEAHLKERRLFTSVDGLTEWLRDVTTPEEQARLTLFLALGQRAA
jgi:hypothetical protein